MQYKILDDLLSESQATDVIEYFKTAHCVNGNKPYDTCPPFWKSTLKHTHIWNIFEDKVHALWDDVYISSIFANGQTKGLDSTPHLDKSSKAELGVLLGNTVENIEDYTEKLQTAVDESKFEEGQQQQEDEELMFWSSST